MSETATSPRVALPRILGMPRWLAFSLVTILVWAGVVAELLLRASFRARASIAEPNGQPRVQNYEPGSRWLELCGSNDMESERHTIADA